MAGASAVLFYNPGASPFTSLVCASLTNSLRPNAVRTVVAKNVEVAKVRLLDGTEHSGNDLLASRLIATAVRSETALWGKSSEESKEVEEWVGHVEKGSMKLPFFCQTLNGRLQLRTFVVGHSLTLADVAAFAYVHKLGGNSSSTDFPADAQKFPHVARWWLFLSSQPAIGLVIAENAIAASATGSGASAVNGVEKRQGGKGGKGKGDKDKGKGEQSKESGEGGESAIGSGLSFPPLTGGEKGKVCTRFAPEPSGYLHIGHVKAAFLANYYAREYGGKLILRFDDTNPAKEKEEFESSIKEDLRTLGIVEDEVTYTSDHFPYLLDFMTELIKKGIMYVDNTSVEEMRDQRGKGIESKCRNNGAEENLRLWEEMKRGSAEGVTCCVRAKIDMKNNNKCMRDPVMYRCNVTDTHHRTGTKYKTYPCYDFACPVVDAKEGVTHAMRSSEYVDRNEQYMWILKACGLRTVEMVEFSRLNLVNTVLSKRKLQWFVDCKKGGVESWEDPRFPTVRGMTRRGLTVEGLFDFIKEQGPSRSTNLMEWDKIWAKNKQVIDPIAPRFMAVGADDAVSFRLAGAPTSVEGKMRPLHQKNPKVGECLQLYCDEVLLEQDDAAACAEGEEVTLMRWGNCFVDKICRDADGKVTSMEGRLHLEGDFKKTKKKLHWVPKLPDQLVPAVLQEFDHLITKKKPEEEDKIEDIANVNSQHDTLALCDPAVRTFPAGTILQLERRGYFRMDSPHWEGKTALVLVKIPDGKSKAMSTVSTKIDPAKLAKGGVLGKG